jgi:hypothetical protein
MSSNGIFAPTTRHYAVPLLEESRNNFRNTWEYLQLKYTGAQCSLVPLAPDCTVKNYIQNSANSAEPTTSFYSQIRTVNIINFTC